MEIIIFEKETYYKMVDELTERILKAVETRNAQPDEDWVDAIEAKRLLKIKSKSKLQNLRDNGDIVFTQHGRTIQYSKTSIGEFLKKHTVRF